MFVSCVNVVIQTGSFNAAPELVNTRQASWLREYLRSVTSCHPARLYILFYNGVAYNAVFHSYKNIHNLYCWTYFYCQSKKRVWNMFSVLLWWKVNCYKSLVTKDRMECFGIKSESAWSGFESEWGRKQRCWDHSLFEHICFLMALYTTAPVQ